MSLGKKDIAKNISSKAHISFETSNQILDKFINLIKSQSKTKTVKISNFGSFKYSLSPRRVGRNPKTMEKFFIPAKTKLLLKVSNNIKTLIN